MSTKLLEEKSDRLVSIFADYFDGIKGEIAHRMIEIKPFLRRVFWVIVGEVVISLSIFFGYVFILLFSHTSYRFVSIFLLIILSSNILAKITVKFIESYND